MDVHLSVVEAVRSLHFIRLAQVWVSHFSSWDHPAVLTLQCPRAAVTACLCRPLLQEVKASGTQRQLRKPRKGHVYSAPLSEQMEEEFCVRKRYHI